MGFFSVWTRYRVVTKDGWSGWGEPSASQELLGSRHRLQSTSWRVQASGHTAGPSAKSSQPLLQVRPLLHGCHVIMIPATDNMMWHWALALCPLPICLLAHICIKMTICASSWKSQGHRLSNEDMIDLATPLGKCAISFIILWYLPSTQ